MNKNGDILGYLKNDLKTSYQTFDGNANPIAVVISGLNNTWSFLNTIIAPNAKLDRDTLTSAVSSFVLTVGDGMCRANE